MFWSEGTEITVGFVEVDGCLFMKLLIFETNRWLPINNPGIKNIEIVSKVKDLV